MIFGMQLKKVVLKTADWDGMMDSYKEKYARRV